MNYEIDASQYLPDGPLHLGAKLLGLNLDSAQLVQFCTYAEMLADWNTRLNLTRIPADQFIPLHFLDSLTLIMRPEFRELTKQVTVGRVVDVGTGAGFPGLPLKIAFPNLQITLMDATAKRLVFLEAVIAKLSLQGISTVHIRAEDAAKQPEHRAQYDIVVARALAKMDKLTGWLLPLVKPDGCAIAMKSAEIDEEMNIALPDLRKLGGSRPIMTRTLVPGTKIERLLVSIRKV